MTSPEDNFLRSAHNNAVLAALDFILLQKSDLPHELLPMRLTKYRLHAKYFSGTWKILCLILEVLDLIILFLCTSVKNQFNKLSSVKCYSDGYPLRAHDASSVMHSPSL